MPPLIDRSGPIEDIWVSVGDHQAIDDCPKAVVGLNHLMQHRDRLVKRPFQLGVILEPTDAVEELVPFLDQLGIIVLQFGVFSDGRAFSQARLLRDRHAYCGDIRAVGDVICDQLSYMQRSGFNQFQLTEGEDIDLAFRILGKFSLSYQSELKQSIAQ
jgi:uncharacterized protein (DUF934 family)